MPMVTDKNDMLKPRNAIRVALKSPLFKHKVVKDKKADHNRKMCRGGVKSRPSHFITLRCVSGTSRANIIERWTSLKSIPISSGNRTDTFRLYCVTNRFAKV